MIELFRRKLTTVKVILSDCQAQKSLTSSDIPCETYLSRGYWITNGQSWNVSAPVRKKRCSRSTNPSQKVLFHAEVNVPTPHIYCIHVPREAQIERRINQRSPGKHYKSYYNGRKEKPLSGHHAKTNQPTANNDTSSNLSYCRKCIQGKKVWSNDASSRMPDLISVLFELHKLKSLR